MRAVVQRVEECSVAVNGEIIGQIDKGILIYLGVESEDTEKDLEYLAEKIIYLRIFQDDMGKMNLSVMDLNLEVQVVSQFTLCADTRKGRRPSYNHAASPQKAKALYLQFIEYIRAKGITVASGRFQESMDVKYINKGPVTILLDSKKNF